MTLTPNPTADKIIITYSLQAAVAPRSSKPRSGIGRGESGELSGKELWLQPHAATPIMILIMLPGFYFSSEKDGRGLYRAVPSGG